MQMHTTGVFSKNLKAFNDYKRLIINEGGTTSSKTWSILQLLIIIAMHTPDLLISIVSESIPHLKRGCIRDYKKIMGEDFDDDCWNASNFTYDFGNGTIIEFFSADASARLRGGRRHILYINECNNITKDSFLELFIRTSKCTFLDFNPVQEFWAHDLIRTEKDVEYIHSTYQDSKVLLSQLEPEDAQSLQNIFDKIESRRHDVNWFRIYGLGLVGNIEGLIHALDGQVDEFPNEPGILVYGLDFGYSSDPTALVKCLITRDTIYSDELIYETGLTNNEIANRLPSFGVKKNFDEIFADAAEPKSIQEIKLYGYNIKGAPKGPDSVENGIQRVNQYKLVWTKRSLNAIKEQRNYKYIQDSSGKITNKPQEGFDHCMDSRRYAILGKLLVKVVIADRNKFFS